MSLVRRPDPSAEKTLFRLRDAELRERLTEAILLLPEQERLVFTLYYYERLTTDEIKQLLGVTDSTISQLHASALSHLDTNLAARANSGTLVVATSGEATQQRLWVSSFLEILIRVHGAGNTKGDYQES
jgi:Sigma-70, region 4